LPIYLYIRSKPRYTLTSTFTTRRSSELHLADNEAYVMALEAAGLLAPDNKVIRTPEELEELAREDADAIVLASEAGVVRTARALRAMRRLWSAWGLPAVVIATGEQARAAREAMEEEDER